MIVFINYLKLFFYNCLILDLSKEEFLGGKFYLNSNKIISLEDNLDQRVVKYFHKIKLICFYLTTSNKSYRVSFRKTPASYHLKIKL